MKTPVLLPVLFFLLCVYRLPGAQEVTVGADGGSLLAAPELESPAVTSVKSGDRLTALDVKPDWVKVAPPPGVRFWVYGELVRDGSVAVSKLGVRSGPGIVHPSVGSLQKGDRVEVVGSEGDWIQIAPPAGSGLWIRRAALNMDGSVKLARPVEPQPLDIPSVAMEPAREAEQPPPSSPPLRVKPRPEPLLEPVPVSPADESVKPSPPPVSSAPAPVAPVAPAPAPVRVRPPLPPVRAESPAPRVLTPSRDVVAVPPVTALPRQEPSVARRIPDVLSDAPLVGSREQGRSVQYKGTVVRTGPVWRWPSSYAMVRPDAKGQPMLVCYVLGSPSKLHALRGRSATLHGEEYWVQGVRRPVVVPQRMVLGR